ALDIGGENRSEPSFDLISRHGTSSAEATVYPQAGGEANAVVHVLPLLRTLTKPQCLFQSAARRLRACLETAPETDKQVRQVAYSGLSLVSFALMTRAKSSRSVSRSRSDSVAMTRSSAAAMAG